MAGMHLRSGTVVGTLPGAPAEELRPLFEEGIGIIMQVRDPRGRRLPLPRGAAASLPTCHGIPL